MDTPVEANAQQGSSRVHISDPAKDKDSLPHMLLHCKESEGAYWIQPRDRRLCVPPYHFERAAILLRKKGDYAGEMRICERWQRIADDYKEQPMVQHGNASKVHEGPRSMAILRRIEKAKQLLTNSQ
ncbi:hypothetical protein [Pseudomonas sp. Leaf127]|uniref:hypothetical protein n=1 Tax=Pseudomonas sp. Leaf127 TaxID=1736267 RepID=UPI0012E7AE58|nr:hypothetical protein [Pseudomonas sp. Leaf127]